MEEVCLQAESEKEMIKLEFERDLRDTSDASECRAESKMKPKVYWLALLASAAMRDLHKSLHHLQSRRIHLLKKIYSLALGTTRQVFLDYAQKLGGSVRLRRDAMSIDAPPVARFFWSDQCSDEHDRHIVQRPIRSDLRRELHAIDLRHDKIDQ
jgi:hypothetical protein